MDTNNSSSVAEVRLLDRTASNMSATSLMALDLIWSSEWKRSIHSSIALLLSSCRVSPASLACSPAILFLNLVLLCSEIPWCSYFRSALSIARFTVWLRSSCRKSHSVFNFVTSLSRVKPLVCKYCCVTWTSSKTSHQKVKVAQKCKTTDSRQKTLCCASCV